MELLLVWVPDRNCTQGSRAAYATEIYQMKLTVHLTLGDPGLDCFAG